MGDRGSFTVVGEGWVSARSRGGETGVAVGPRCAVTENGQVLCTFMVQSNLGMNDFVPMQAVSPDGGATWEEAAPIWPRLARNFSIFCSISHARSGELLLYGTRTRIDTPGESFWCEATQGLKANDLIWARSLDGGCDWTEPAVIPMPIPGAAEAPGPMCVTSTGRSLICYAPYNTFDSSLAVDRNQVVLLSSGDERRSWRHTIMFRFAEADSGGAEAWVIELSDGRLLGACWQVGYGDGQEYSTPYALSADGGSTWTPVLRTGIRGQSTGLSALPDGRALLVYNQRKHGEPGVWLAVARPSEFSFGVETNQIVWRAEQTTRHDSSAEHIEWKDFAFGEPSATVLPDGAILIALWCVQPSGQGIRYVKLRWEEA